MANPSFDELMAKMPTIAGAVNAFSSESVQQLAFQALVRCFAGEAVETDVQSSSKSPRRQPSQKRRGARGIPTPESGDGKTAIPKRRSVTPTFVKDLNLRPNGNQSFKDFVAAKRPGTNHERNALSVYWLTRVAGLSGVTVDHVYSCYKEVTWKVPPNLANSLAVTANKKGWLNTEDMQDLRVTVKGENLVEHDLPHKATAA
jgi:hypothetical protein